MLPTAVVRGRKNPLFTKLGVRLRRARKAAGLSGSALSLAAGLGRNTVAAIEDGGRLPRLPLLERLANALQIAPAYLAFGFRDTAWEPAAELRCEGVAERARAAREARGLSVREAERVSGSSVGAVRALEQGGWPRVDTIEALANALGVSVAWLAYQTGPMEMPRCQAKRSSSSPAAPP